MHPAKKQLLLETVPPTLSWYGGEPFLNFDLIKKSAAYFKSLPWEKYGIPVASLGFTANTNLSIINEEILNFLVANAVTLFVSLDGPQEEHDKCRVLANSAGTFALAYPNLMKIKAYSPEYFKNKVTIFGVYTSQHDYAQCVDFTGKLGALSCQHFSVDYAGTFVFDIAAETAYYESALANKLENYEKMIAAVENDSEAQMKKETSISSSLLMFLFVRILSQFLKLESEEQAGPQHLIIFSAVVIVFEIIVANCSYDIFSKRIVSAYFEPFKTISEVISFKIAI